MVQIPVFQMKLGLDEASRPAWLFADEGPDDQGSFAFTIPSMPYRSFQRVELTMAGERAGKFEEFRLHFNGHVFVEPETGIRFAPGDSNDFRGITFDQVGSYIGSGQQTLRRWFLPRITRFQALYPLDLIRMDEAFTKHRMIFSGTTQSYGRHHHADFVPFLLTVKPQAIAEILGIDRESVGPYRGFSSVRNEEISLAQAEIRYGE